MYETSSQFSIQSNQVNKTQRDHTDWFHQWKQRSGLGVKQLFCYLGFPSRAQAGESHSVRPPSLLAVTRGKPPSCLWRLHTRADIAEKTPSLDKAQWRAPEGLCPSSCPTRVCLPLEQKPCVLVSVFSFSTVLVLKAPRGDLWLLRSSLWEQGKPLQQRKECQGLPEGTAYPERHLQPILGGRTI